MQCSCQKSFKPQRMQLLGLAAVRNDCTGIAGAMGARFARWCIGVEFQKFRMGGQLRGPGFCMRFARPMLLSHGWVTKGIDKLVRSCQQ